jgi:hypothetical protein
VSGETLDTGGTLFKTVLWIVTAIFGASLIAWGVVGLCVASPTPPQTAVFNGLDWVVKLTLGAMPGS